MNFVIFSQNQGATHLRVFQQCFFIFPLEIITIFFKRAQSVFTLVFLCQALSKMSKAANVQNVTRQN